jgi:hypothetical protein
MTFARRVAGSIGIVTPLAQSAFLAPVGVEILVDRLFPSLDIIFGFVFIASLAGLERLIFLLEQSKQRAGTLGRNGRVGSEVALTV